jgi:hypothetical protein
MPLKYSWDFLLKRHLRIVFEVMSRERLEIVL